MRVFGKAPLLNYDQAMTKSITLGETAEYADTYSPNFLQPIERNPQTAQLKTKGGITGADIWTAYELSWLDGRGKPQVAMAKFSFPSDSPAIVESKSFKYYLNSLNQTRYDSWAEVKNILANDLQKISKSKVCVELLHLDERQSFQGFVGDCVDDLNITIDTYELRSDLLSLEEQETFVDGACLYSHLLKTNCPVTNQPDWGSVWIKYSGRKICHASFLRYIISYRKHSGFHESCVESIFSDIWNHCNPEKLTVYGRYTRRGGLDINPFRTSCNEKIPNVALYRQ